MASFNGRYLFCPGVNGKSENLASFHRFYICWLAPPINQQQNAKKENKYYKIIFLK